MLAVPIGGSKHSPICLFQTLFSCLCPFNFSCNTWDYWYRTLIPTFYTSPFQTVSSIWTIATLVSWLTREPSDCYEWLGNRHLDVDEWLEILPMPNHLTDTKGPPSRWTIVSWLCQLIDEDSADCVSWLTRTQLIDKRCDQLIDYRARQLEKAID
jgi:hypothetical protein